MIEKLISATQWFDKGDVITRMHVNHKEREWLKQTFNHKHEYVSSFFGVEVYVASHIPDNHALVVNHKGDKKVIILREDNK